MLASSSKLLTMSLVPQKTSLSTLAPGQLDPRATCPACSMDLGHRVSMLVQRYEQLQDMVNSLAASRPSKKAKLQSQVTRRPSSQAATPAPLPWVGAVEGTDIGGGRRRAGPGRTAPCLGPSGMQDQRLFRLAGRKSHLGPQFSFSYLGPGEPPHQLCSASHLTGTSTRLSPTHPTRHLPRWPC